MKKFEKKAPVARDVSSSKPGVHFEASGGLARKSQKENPNDVSVLLEGVAAKEDT
jgi:hypothetical protein